MVASIRGPNSNGRGGFGLTPFSGPPAAHCGPGARRDGKAGGDPSRGRPIRGDAVARRRRDMTSRHQGDYWIGGWEKKGDAATGTLTSVPFTVTHPWASFLVGGGPYPDTC